MKLFNPYFLLSFLFFFKVVSAQIIDEDKKKKKAVFGVNKKTEQIEIRFESIADASRSLGGPTKGTGLIKSLKHPGRYSWKGFYWYYSQ